MAAWLVARGNKTSQQQMLTQSVTLARQLCDKQQQAFALSGIITFSDKIIDPEFSKMIRRWLQMTQVGRLFEMEKQEAIRENIALTKREISLNLHRSGMEAEQIALAVNESIALIRQWLSDASPAPLS